ncbi:SDR family oxidoreductase [Benzoatithermus flavus]|uniref:SDR family oxidoreductase n=1 Tax=Benzoatithermus flavus TaxID=3108223 RepID=A0ABU8XUU6_9PROT
MPQCADGAVVITGASSGIGRATAQAFAREGACLALCARGAEALQETVRECRRLGGHAFGVPTDTRDPEAVKRLARMAAETFGGIGVWVNNAGGGAVGRYWEVPIAAHRATVETDLLGYLHGAHAALPYFLDRGRGVLVNNISIGGLIPTPYAASYAAAKTAVRAFADSLRQELASWPDIHVCSVFPYFVDTPGIYHAANYTGRALKPAPFVVRPEQVAAAVLGLAREPRREVVVGIMGKLGRLEHAIAPRLVEAALRLGTEAYLAQAKTAPVSDGNLFHPMPEPMAVTGGWRHSGLRTAAAVLGLAAAGFLAVRAIPHGWKAADAQRTAG